jgi:integrase
LRAQGFLDVRECRTEGAFQVRLPRQFLFAGRCNASRGFSTRQYARLLAIWTASIGLDPRIFGTHSLRRTKAALIYRRTGNLRAVQLLLGHTKIESTVRYLGSRSTTP